MMGNKEADTMIGVYASDYLHLTEIVVLYNIREMYQILTNQMKNYDERLIKSISTILLLSWFFTIVKSQVSYCIPCLYLTCVIAASAVMILNMKAIQRTGIQTTKIAITPKITNRTSVTQTWSQIAWHKSEYI